MRVNELSDMQLQYASIYHLQVQVKEGYNKLADILVDLGKAIGSDEIINTADTLRLSTEAMNKSIKILWESFDAMPGGDKIKTFIEEHSLFFNWAERGNNELAQE